MKFFPFVCTFSPSVQASSSAILMEAIPLCLQLSKPYLFSLTHTNLLNQSELLSLVCYMYQPVLRPSSDMSTPEYIQKDTTES